MFQVVHKKTGVVKTVYGINGLYFLFWNEAEACWEGGYMDDYRPVEVTA